MREQKMLKYPQAWFVECAHGNGHAQAAGEARGHLDRTHRVGVSAGTSVLSAAKRAAGGGGVRRVCRGAVCEVLCGQVRRPSLTPGIYFRSLLIGYFEGLDSERGIA